MDGAVGRQLSALFQVGVVGDLSDGQLLERFATGPSDEAELAFEALVDRHGAMVSRVCRAQLGDGADTLDAFQATFLILIKRARSLWVRESLGPWLHQVAFRTAVRARVVSARRRTLERRVAREETVLDGAGAGDWERILHEEIDRLPERYRVPIILCDLEGQSCEEVARRMGRPVGTVKSWRARGRERLRGRFIRRGLAPAVAVTAATAQGALANPAVSVALRTFSEAVISGTISESIRTLVKGVLQAMLISKLQVATTAVLASVLLTVALGGLGWVMADDPKPSIAPDAAKRELQPTPAAVVAEPKNTRVDYRTKMQLERVSKVTREILNTPRPSTKDGEAWPMSLRDAINIALDNSGERVRVRVNQSRPVGGFELAVEKIARIEDPKPAASEGALGELQRVTQPGGPIHHPRTLRSDGPVYEISPLTNDVDPQEFKLESMAQVRSVEQLYWLLSQAHIQLWAADRVVSLAKEVLEREQAELVAGRGTVADVAETVQAYENFNLDLATRTSDLITTERQLRNLLGLYSPDHRRIIPTTAPIEAKIEPDWSQSLAAMVENHPRIVRAKAKVNEAASGKWDNWDNGFFELDKQRKAAEQVLHETTQSLARFFLEIDASYKQTQNAARLRATAAQRLDAQRAFYEEGRITVDRFLNAVSQYGAAVATEAQCKTTYNIAITAMEEAKGTLLEYDKIHVMVNEGTATAAAAGRGPSGPTGSRPGGPKIDEAGRTVSFDFTVGVGAVPVQVRGSFTVGPTPGR